LTRTVVELELFSTLHFSVKHGGSASATARQQTYCARNLEQGGGEVPLPSVLRKEQLWNNSRIGTAQEALGRPYRRSSLDGPARRKVTMI